MDPNGKYPYGQGEIKKASSKLTQTWRQVRNNPNQPYHFLRTVGAGLTLLPVGRAVGAGVNLIKSRIGIGAGAKLGGSALKEYKVGGKLYGHFTKSGKLTNQFVKSEHMAPSLNTNRIAQSFVDKKIKGLTKDIPLVGKTGFAKGSYMDKFHAKTGLNKTFFDNVKTNNPGATSRTGGVFPLIDQAGRSAWNAIRQVGKN